MALQAPPALLWLDLETTGLNPERGRILEVCAVLDCPKSSAPEAPLGGHEAHYVLGVENRAQVTMVDKVIRHPEPVEALPWEQGALEMHLKSGLCEELAKNSRESATMGEVEDRILDALSAFPTRSVMLAGSSVHFDRAWLRVHASKVDAVLSHRHMDTSCIGTFMAMLGDPVIVPRSTGHRAHVDVWHSIRTFYAAADKAWGWQQHSAELASIRRLFTGMDVPR